MTNREAKRGEGKQLPAFVALPSIERGLSHLIEVIRIFVAQQRLFVGRELA